MVFEMNLARKQSEIEDIDFIIERIFSIDKSRNIELLIEQPPINSLSRAESTLNSIIQDKIKTQALPISLRKRLMYQRAIE